MAVRGQLNVVADYMDAYGGSLAGRRAVQLGFEPQGSFFCRAALVMQSAA